ncbi:hypothetical protein J31TS4_23300 [Paenibacillus sp. J31TS4]|nr:hypothetical protein J31TS4_23300 [Paenibacillus sp. J31TS4]
MLADIERKVLRILYNYMANRGRYPSIDELMIKTGRTRKDLYDALSTLTDHEYSIEKVWNGYL